MSDFQEVKDAFDLESWMEREGIDFKIGRGSSGMQINAKVCPACGDRRWRVYINADSGLGNCFVCDLGFNKYKFVSKTEGLEGAALVRYMRDAIIEQGWKPRRLAIADVDFGEVKLPLSYELPTADGQTLVYLKKRGLTAEITKFFRLRYCASGWWNFLNEDGSKGGQCFDGRVILPVFDLDGSLVTFQGRDITGNAERKYLFPMMLPGTGRYLYNGQNARGAKRAVLGEGGFDVIAMKMAFDDVVDLRDVIPLGSFGKHLSYGAADGNDQLSRFGKLKAEGLVEVTIMWDGEWKAIKSALDAAKRLRGIGLAVKIAKLPKDKDPNEVLPQVVTEAFYKATPYTTKLDVLWRLRDPYS